MTSDGELTSSVGRVVPDTDGISLSTSARVCVTSRPTLRDVKAGADPVGATARETDGEGRGFRFADRARRRSAAVVVFLDMTY